MKKESNKNIKSQDFLFKDIILNINMFVFNTYK